MKQQWVAYLEALGAGAVVAGLQAAYQAVQQQGHTVDWQPVLAAWLVGAMGYLLAALRWLQTPVPEPPEMTAWKSSFLHGGNPVQEAPVAVPPKAQVPPADVAK